MFTRKTKKMRLWRMAAACSLLILTLALAGCAQQAKPAPDKSADPVPQSDETIALEAQTEEVAQGDDLVIPVADITDTAAFYLIEIDGTEMEVIAVRAPDGTIRTAFNTCQICYDSGRGYYKQAGDVLVCQNCGNRFPMSRVEVEAGGCNPWPIFAKDKTVTSESIAISGDFLRASKEIFENWKKSY